MALEACQNIKAPIPFSKNMPFFRSSLFILLFSNYRTPVPVRFPSCGHTLCRSVRSGSRCGRADGRDSMFCSLITMISSLNIPYIRFQRISTTANTHFSKVADSVFCFWKTLTVVSLVNEHASSASTHRIRPLSWPIHTLHSRLFQAQARRQPCTMHKAPSLPKDEPFARRRCRNAH